MTRLINSLLILAILIVNPVVGQTKMKEEQKMEFLNDLVLSFEEEFLWQKKGQQIAVELKAKIENGDYKSITEADIFVETLTRDLFKLSNDRHLSIDLYNQSPQKTSRKSASENAPTFQMELISDGLYYLKFDEFPSLDETTELEIADLMSSIIDARKIIIDLRDNTGGSDETVNHLIGYFFKEKKKLATTYQWNSPSKELWSIPKPQSDFLSKTTLIILTSQSTFSAAEIFTQRLQLHDRAIIIGEKTPGAGHRTATYLMSDIFLLNWPYEKSLHSMNEQDLEGKGILPDYSVHYNSAKRIAIRYAETGGIKTISKLPVAGTSLSMIDALMEALNSSSEHAIEAFVTEYGSTEKYEQVLHSLYKFKTVWNDQLSSNYVNIHQLPDNKTRIFVQTSYGIIQIKISQNIENRIEQIMTRL